MSMLAQLLEARGEEKEAVAILRRTLAGWEAAQGMQHHRTLAVLGQLAALQQKTGMHAEAERHFRELLAADEQLSGPLSDMALNTAFNLAQSLLSQKDQLPRFSAEIEVLLRRVSDNSKTELGAVASETLGLLLKQLNRGADAAPLLLQALHAYERVHGVAALETLQCLHNLAVVEHDLARFQDARTHYNRALEGLTESLGAGHELTKRCHHDLQLCIEAERGAKHGRPYDKPWRVDNMSPMVARKKK
jgi:tetratricopeptide (TPR) repeat protein